MREKFFKTSCKSYRLCEREISEMAKRYGISSIHDGSLPDLIMLKAKASGRQGSRKDREEELALALLDSSRCREMQDTINYVDSEFEKIQEKFGEQTRSEIWDVYVDGLGIKAVSYLSDPPVSTRTLNRRIRNVLSELFQEENHAAS